MLLIFAAVKKSGLPNGARWASSKNQLRNAPCQQQGFSERDQPTSTRCRWWFTMIHCDMSVLWTDISTSPKNVSWLMVMVDDVLRSCWRTSNDWSRSTSADSGGGRVDETFFFRMFQDIRCFYHHPMAPWCCKWCCILMSAQHDSGDDCVYCEVSWVWPPLSKNGKWRLKGFAH